MIKLTIIELEMLLNYETQAPKNEVRKISKFIVIVKEVTQKLGSSCYGKY